jgi:hypothetical protein
MSEPIGVKADALPGELIGDGTAGIRASASSPQRLAQHVFHSPRLNRMQRPAAIPTTKSCRELGDGEAKRDAGKPTDWPLPDHTASRAVALDVRIALSSKLFDGGVQWLHDPQHSRTARAPDVCFNSNIEKGRPAAGCAIMHRP